MVWMHEAVWKEQHECNLRVRGMHVRKKVSSLLMSLLDICSGSEYSTDGFDVALNCWKDEAEE